VPTPQVTVADAAQATEVVEGMARVRAELGVADGFPADVLAAAEAAARSTARTSGRPDRTDVALVTIDPPGSRDLDQAYGAERRPGGGYRIWYAIADVAAFVEPGGTLDAECHGRGVTLYGPDRREALHPPALEADSRAGAFSRAALDLVEALVLPVVGHVRAGRHLASCGRAPRLARGLDVSSNSDTRPVRRRVPGVIRAPATVCRGRSF